MRWERCARAQKDGESKEQAMISGFIWLGLRGMNCRFLAGKSEKRQGLLRDEG
jgi:hypothetical protein